MDTLYLQLCAGFKEDQTKIDAITIEKRPTPIDLVVSEHNLINLSDFFYAQQVPYYVFFGTLLGAMRDGDFAVMDADTDILIHESALPKLVPFLVTGHVVNFELLRCVPSNFLLCADGEYIDVTIYLDSEDDYFLYGAHKGKYDIRKCDMRPGCNITIHGREYPTIHNAEKYLTHWYGDWSVPRSRQWCMENLFYNNLDQRIVFDD